MFDRGDILGAMSLSGRLERWKAELAFALVLGMGIVLFVLMNGIPDRPLTESFPPFELHVGDLELAGYTTNVPECPPLPCELDADNSGQEYFTIWLFKTTRSAEGVSISSNRILAIPITRP